MLRPKFRTVPSALKSMVVLLFLFHGASCQTGDKKKSSKDEPVRRGSKSEASDQKESEKISAASSRRATLVNSLSNSSLTSRTISLVKAESQAQSLNSNRNKAELEGRLSAQRLARQDLGKVFSTAKKIAAIEMQKGGAERSLADPIKLEMALAAINSKKFAMAEFYLQDLFKSKNAKVRAGAYTAIGVVALRDQRVPEAVDAFKKSLKAIPNYKPALLNLGFAALKGGDLKAAKRAFSGMQSDWFVQYGMITISRVEGNSGRVKELCNSVLQVQPDHKPTLFNCALHFYQSERNFKEAKTYLNRMVKSKGGAPSWDEMAKKLITKIDNDPGGGRGGRSGKKSGRK